ncbi:pirin family protein [Rapidithrix thailandica]|uniref:Pirin family protein n=1 Tax=Rapidithrix thailandica TaxID=413964 RepID=A0AAW9S6A8_9BACT
MNTIVHKADTRGHANHGWLNAHHTFSFANYHDPERVHFGVLRVLNDDVIQGGGGFGMHPHDNMEIITIPLQGALEHKDSMGNSGVIRKNEIQVMSAGTGVFHSEFNKSTSEAVNLLQIWVFPNKRDVEPRYEQIAFDPKERHNRLQQVLSPNPDDEGMWVYQDTWFHRGNLDQGFETRYQLKKKGNGLYLFVIEGEVTVANQSLERRDGMGIWNADQFQLQANTQAEVLLMEVPMDLAY